MRVVLLLEVMELLVDDFGGDGFHLSFIVLLLILLILIIFNGNNRKSSSHLRVLLLRVESVNEMLKLMLKARAKQQYYGKNFTGKMQLTFYLGCLTIKLRIREKSIIA